MIGSKQFVSITPLLLYLLFSMRTPPPHLPIYGVFGLPGPIISFLHSRNENLLHHLLIRPLDTHASYIHPYPRLRYHLSSPPSSSNPLGATPVIMSRHFFLSPFFVTTFLSFYDKMTL
jgi:hypothetical protein